MDDLGGLDQHTKVCPKRPWQCQYCDTTATYDVGANEHLPQCLKFPEPCPNGCEKGTVERCNLEKHLASECSLQLVACEFSHAGCTEKVPRKDLARHMEDGMQKHLLSMSLLNLSLTRELHQKMDEKDRQITELQLQLQQLDGKVEQHFHNSLVGSVFTKEFTLTEFRKAEKRENFHSEPFYSGWLRYKFKFNIDFADTQMRVYLYLLKGDHDDHLNWPIKCIVRIKILNQVKDHDHIERSASWEWGKTTSQTYKQISAIEYLSLTPAHLKGDSLRCELCIIVK